MPPTRIFVAYRQDDAGELASRLAHQIRGRWPESNVSVFHDKTSQLAGSEYATKALEAASHSDVVLALIGPEWAGDASGGGRRIEDSEDLLHHELLRARHSDATTIPVFHNGANWESMSPIPATLSWLESLDARKISRSNYDGDIAALIASIGEQFELDSTQSPNRNRLVIGIAVGALIIAALTLVTLQNRPGKGGPQGTGTTPAELTLLVRVVDSDDDPIAAADVALFVGGTSQQSVTGTDGTAILSRPSGPATLRVTHPDFESYESEVGRSTTQRKVVLPSPNEHRIQIQVIPADGNDALALTVIIDVGGLPTSDVTDDFGRVFFFVEFTEDPMVIPVTVRLPDGTDVRDTLTVRSNELVARILLEQ